LFGQNECNNKLRQFASSAAVHDETGNFKDSKRRSKRAQIGRAESVSWKAYQCLSWSVSNHAPSRFWAEVIGAYANGLKMKKPSSIATATTVKDFDQARNCWENIVTIVELLRGCAESEWMKPEVVRNASDIMLRETRKLDALLTKFERRILAG
jgi:hypothetical protein